MELRALVCAIAAILVIVGCRKTTTDATPPETSATTTAAGELPNVALPRQWPASHPVPAGRTIFALLSDDEHSGSVVVLSKEDAASTLASVSAAMKAAGFKLKKEGDLNVFPAWLWNRGAEECSVTIESSEKASRGVLNGNPVDLTPYPTGVTLLYVESSASAPVPASPKASTSATAPTRGKRVPAH